MTELILARHGETSWNLAEIFRGRIDIELNETGVKQAEMLAKHLGNVKIAAIYTSPLKRASKTAGIIAGYHDIEVDIAPGIIDFNYGKWEGLSHQEVKVKYNKLYSDWISHPERIKMPDGESLGDVRKRAMDVIHSMISRYDDTVVLVSHRVVNKILICALLGLDNSHFWNIKQDTCGTTNFTCQNGRFTLDKHNDTSYLNLTCKTQLNDF